ncbi:hypothetical protein QWJ41_14795 [Nocardioides sp. SOB44]|uniref:Uncharacterized protein n=1 Tax=Nocardioides cremeus TaxID=3058044 RepID=A0ABT8TX80_9ACTN|nr:hypothetical protein [Nocardioides cremeus]MDO3396992.1 hypothetical protein [Nocardioides cremeus]
MESSYEVEVPASISGMDSWFTVRGANLEHDIEVKVRMLGPDRPAVFAIRIDDHREVTSRHLRSLRLPAIARAVLEKVAKLAEELESTADEAVWLRSHTGPLYDARGDPTAALELAEEGAAALNLREWLEAVEGASSDLEQQSRGRGARSATEEDLRTFARIYLEELMQDSAGVVNRTAARVHMSRPTAYRWLDNCREQNLVPAREDDL